MANNKRRKVDKENRVFKEEWTEEFILILNQKSNLPQCLKYNFQASVTEKDNIQRHFPQIIPPLTSPTPQCPKTEVTK